MKHQEIIALTHDVPANPKLISELIDRLPSIVNARSSSLVVVERSHSTGQIDGEHSVMSSCIDQQAMIEYNKHYIHYERKFGEQVLSSPAGTICIDSDFSNRDTIIQRPDVAFAISRLGILDRFAIRLNDEAAWSDILAFQYPVHRGNVTDHEFSNLETLIPVLAQSVSQMRLFESIRRKFNAVFSVLNRLDLAVCILDEAGRLVITNENADELIQNSRHLSRSNSGKLKLPNADADKSLQNAISVMSLSARGESDHTKEVVQLGSDIEPDNLFLELSPLSDSQSEIDRGFRGALLIAIDPNRETKIPADTLRLFYGLTAAESEVASLIGDGHSYITLADARNVNIETVKTQVSSLYRKMRVTTRAEMLRKIFSIVTPFKD